MGPHCSLPEQNSALNNIISQSPIGQEYAVNNLIAQSTPAILCGPDCQKQKTDDELKQKYINAQTNVKTAPGQLNVAEKNYITAVEGTPAYNAMMTAKYTKEATTIADATQTALTEDIATATNLTNVYDGLFINKQYIQELYDDYIKKNAELTLKIKNLKADIATNNRKSFYEDEQFDNVTWWYYGFIMMYIVLLIVYAIAMFVSPSSYSFLAKIGILSLLLLYPFIITNVSLWLLAMFKNLISILPTNVYTSL